MAMLPGGTQNTRYIDLGGGLFGVEDGAFTIEFWVTAKADPGNNNIISIGDSDAREILLRTNGGLVARGASSESFTTVSAMSCAKGKTYHFSIVIGALKSNNKRDVTFRRFDVATGAKDAEHVCTDRTYSPITMKEHFYFGKSFHNNNPDANIDIDEVRIWRAALSEEQLAANVAREPDELPLLGFKAGSGPVKIASGATFDLGGNTISYPGLAGAGTVRNGSMTVGTLNVTGAMRLEGDVTVTGEIVFAEGASLVTTGALNINGATARYTGVMSDRSLVLASAEGTGSISGTPAAVDLGANRGYRLNVGGNLIKISRPGFIIIIR